MKIKIRRKQCEKWKFFGGKYKVIVNNILGQQICRLIEAQNKLISVRKKSGISYHYEENGKSAPKKLRKKKL